MKRWLIILLLPLMAEAVEGPKLVCDEPVYKFGHVDQSAVITNIFTVRNEGDLSFVLNHVQRSCSCTKGRMNRRVIGPGETAELTAIYRATRRQGPQKKSLKLIPLNSNEPALVFYMEGFVEPAADSH